jgi:hypothetical protein
VTDATATQRFTLRTKIARLTYKPSAKETAGLEPAVSTFDAW